jgi:enoyl-CoA hydratase
MSPEQPLVLYEVEDKVAVITLNRPEKRNALTRELWRQLDGAFIRADEDSEVRAIVLTGAGPAFCAGADLTSGQDREGLLHRWEHFEALHQRQFRMWSSKKIIIAAVHGYCLGRGLELALWCDIVVASADSSLGQPEIREGWVLHSVVPWLTGPQQAKLFMLSGDTIDAAEAQRLGLVARVVDAGSAIKEAMRLGKRLSYIPPAAAQAVKQEINGVYEQMGFRVQQAAGTAVSALASALTPKELGNEELFRIRREQGLRASLKFRDAPFES